MEKKRRNRRARQAYVWQTRPELRSEFESRTGLSLGNPPEDPHFGHLWSFFPYPGCCEELEAALRDMQVWSNRAVANLDTTANREIALAHDELRRVRDTIASALDGPAGWLFPGFPYWAREGGWAQRLIEADRSAAKQEREHPDGNRPLEYPVSQVIAYLLYRLRDELCRVEIPENPEHRPADPGVTARREMVEALSRVRRAVDGKPLSNHELTLLLIIIGVKPWANSLPRCVDSLRKLGNKSS